MWIDPSISRDLKKNGQKEPYKKLLFEKKRNSDDQN